PPVQNTPPTVTVDQPLNGASFEEGTTVALNGSATDTESGNLSSFILWNSNVDGFLGTGSSLNVNLSVGDHTITASVADTDNASSSSSISISVEEGDDTGAVVPMIYIIEIQKSVKQYGSTKTAVMSNNINFITVIEVRSDTNLNGLKDEDDEPLANTDITILITNSSGQSWTLNGKTDDDGKEEFKLRHVPMDTYNSSILEVSHSEYKSYEPAFGNETVSANYYLK
ncbi:MAG: Ig-like domain-containing protein, partial [Candidatus Neomarinimicrobiota bacterium]